jgi:hypothetical protein
LEERSGAELVYGLCDLKASSIIVYAFILSESDDPLLLKTETAFVKVAVVYGFGPAAADAVAALVTVAVETVTGRLLNTTRNTHDCIKDCFPDHGWERGGHLAPLRASGS